MIRPLLILLLCNVCFGQNWQWLSPLPQGNNLNDITFADPQNGWAVGDAGTVLHSGNGGRIWLGESVPAAGHDQLLRIVFTDSLHGWILGSTYENYFDQTIVLRTDDGGETWIRENDSRFDHINDLDFPDPRHGFMCGVDWQGTRQPIVLRTGDGGMTWDSLSFDSVLIGGSNVGFADSLTGGVALLRGFMFTSDGGQTWDLHARDASVTEVEFSNAHHAWICDYWGSLSHSEDGGATWQQTDSITSAHGPLQFTDSLHGWSFGNGGIIHTSNGGATWTLSPAPPNSNLNSIRGDDAQDEWVVGDAGAIYHSTTAGTNWNLVAGGVLRNYVAVCFTDIRNGWLAGYESGQHCLWHSTDGGAHWPIQLCSDTLSLNELVFTDSLHGWALSYYGTLLHTSNGGINWSVIYQGWDSQYASLCFVDSLHGWMSGYFNSDINPRTEIFKTVDGGYNWSWQWARFGEFPFYPIVFPDSLVGWALYSGDLYRTVDGGTTWQSLHTPGVAGADLSASDSLHCWIAAGQDGLLMTTDGGVSWRNPYQSTTNRVRFADRHNGWIQAGDSFLRTQDGGWNWTSDSIQVAVTITDLVAVDSAHAWAVGWNSSVLRCNVVAPAVSRRSFSSSPLSYSLSSFPNPFNPVTELRYDLAKAGFATLKIYNIMGGEVITLVDKRMSAGSYLIQWNAAAYPSGMYFAVLRSGEKRIVQKLLLLK